MEIHKQPFHMDGMKIVCNVCGEKFSNVVLFGNHTHRADQKRNNMAFQRSVPKPDHKTFSTMSEEEMVEAFHKMPELEGCWIKNGRYVCNMCGKSCPNPYLLFSHKIIHPSDMTPFSRVKETDFQQTQGVATQTTIEHGFRNCKRNHKGNLIKDHGKKIKKVWDISCESSNKDVEGDDDNVQNVVKTKKKMKVTNPGKQKAKPLKTLLYKSLISVDKMSTNVKSKPPLEQIVMEPEKESKPSTGGIRMDLSVSSDNDDEESDSTPSDSDVDEDGIGNQPGRPNQKPETTQVKKKETHLYRSLIAVKGQSFVKPMTPPPYEYCINMFGHKFLDKCKLMKGRYYCDECPSLCSSPYLLLNHKLYHAKRKYLYKRRAAQEGTTGKKEEAQIGTTNKKNEAQVGITDKDEETQMGTTDMEEEAEFGTTDKDEETPLDETDKEEETQLGTIDKEVEEDGMCFECNMCQVKFYNSDGLADHIEVHAVDTQAGISCTFSERACTDVSKVSTSACSKGMTADAIVVKVKEERITSYENDQDVNEPQLESSGLDTSVRIKQDPEPPDLPQHNTEDRIQTGEMDMHLEDKLFLKRLIFSPVVRLKRIEVEQNEVYIVK